MNRLIILSIVGCVCILTFSCSSGTTAGGTRETASPPDSAIVADTTVATADSSAQASADSLENVADSASARTDTVAVITITERADTMPAESDSTVLEDSLAADSVVVPPDSLSPQKTAAIAPREAADSAQADTTQPEPNPLALRYNAIYLNGGAVARDDLLEKYIVRAKRHGIGGFVMDMKDDRGYLTWRSENPVAKQIGARTGRLTDPARTVKLLHDNGLIACARVVAFKDPLLSSYNENGAYPYAVLDSSTGFPWKQNNGETWANMQDERVHDYLTGIIKELVDFGFDQIQLDYIRFPSDGPTELCFYPLAIDSLNKAEVIGLFLSKVRSVVDSAGASLSADVFGWVPWLSRERSYWIGQDYDMIARWTDVICPMLYSSHFPEEFKADYDSLRAYHIILEGTRKGVSRRGRRNTGVQPYIQAFNYRSPHYGPDYIIQQMQAAIEGGGVGWIAWNARSDYSMLWKALEKYESEYQVKRENK